MDWVLPARCNTWIRLDAQFHVGFYEDSGNDMIDRTAMVNIIHLHALTDTWAIPPSVVWVSAAYQQLTNIGVFNELYEHNTRWLDTLCKVQGRGNIPVRRVFQMLRDGYDPCVDWMRFAVPSVGFRGTLGNANCLGSLAKAFTLGTVCAGSPAHFWAAVGNVIAINMGAANDQHIDCAPAWMVGYDPDGSFPGGVADTLWIQGNLSTDLPGLALPHGPKSTVLGGFNISAGSNVLDYTPAHGGPAIIFGSEDNGNILTIPGAGDTSLSQSLQHLRGYPTNPWLGSVSAPMVGYMRYVSGTRIAMFQDPGLTIALNAVTAVSTGTPQVVMRGSPRIYTSISGIAADPAGETLLRIGHKNDEAFFQYRGKESSAIHTLIAKSGMRNTPILMAGGSTDIRHAGIWTVGRINYGLPDFAVSADIPPILYEAPFLDEQLIGITGQAAKSGGQSIYGGTPGNHPATLMREIWARALATVDLVAP